MESLQLLLLNTLTVPFLFLSIKCGKNLHDIPRKLSDLASTNHQPSIQYHFHRKHHSTLKAEFQIVSRPDFPLFFWKYPNTKFISKRLTTQDISDTNYYRCSFCIIFITQNTPSIFPHGFTSMHLHHGLCLMTCSLVGTTCHLYLNGKRKKTHHENTTFALCDCNML